MYLILTENQSLTIYLMRKLPWKTMTERRSAQPSL
jgi:hypothetical protein